MVVNSTKSMRAEGGYEKIKAAIEKLGLRHKEHIAAYGEGNEKRLTGKHETASMDKFSWVSCPSINFLATASLSPICVTLLQKLLTTQKLHSPLQVFVHLERKLDSISSSLNKFVEYHMDFLFGRVLVAIS